MFREIVGALLGNSAVKLFLVLYGWLAGLGLGYRERPLMFREIVGALLGR